MKHVYTISFIACLIALFFPLSSHGQLFEDFEEGNKSGYAAASVQFASGSWFFYEALVGVDDRDRKMGTRSARLRHDRPDPSIAMEFDIDGAGEVRFYHANSGFTGDTGGKVQLQYSQNQGANWTNIGNELTSPAEVLGQASIDVNVAGDIRFRIIKTAGGRVNIDNFEVTPYEEPSEDPRLRVEVNGTNTGNNAEVDFGTVMTDSESQRTFTFTNTGQNTLTVSDFSLSDHSVFKVDGNPEGSLEMQESASVIITFEPDAFEHFTSTLSFTTNDPDHGSFELTLKGRGLPSDEPIDIADARELPLGTIVTVAGWVTVTDELSGPIYFQDETGGMASYYNALMRDEEFGFTLEVAHGDSIVVRGPLTHFNNLLQIAPVEDVMDHVEYNVFPEANRHIEPLSISVAELETGDYEGQLVKLVNVMIHGSGSFSGEVNYDITDGMDESEIRISQFTNLPGMNIPNVPVDIIGAASFFQQDIQVFPRSRADIIQIGDAPLIITPAPYEIAATAESITFYWETDRPGTTEICYGETVTLELGCVEDAGLKEEHALVLDGLDAATIYQIQLRSAVDTDTSWTDNHFVTTTSPPGASQDINVYFNKSVDHTLATFQNAEQNRNYADHYIQRIFQAQHSIDVAFYSTSGDAGLQIANFLGQAHNRGLDVRVILDHTTSTDAVKAELQSNGVPVIESDFGNMNRNRDGIHHNKFAIIDYKGGNPEDVWLITSSWNATDQGTNDQYQNMVEFQDVSIAGAYTREFDQMWGSTTTTPSSANARFGENKEVVNPSVFWIGDSYVRLHFSPQGGTENAIINAINNAEHSINVATMLITRFGINNALRARHDAGLTIRGLISNTNVTGSQFDNLASWGDFIHFPQANFGLLHHKYAIVDGEDGSWNGTVITGSHNWSGAANLVNDENTLFITDSRIANLYMQEFGARYAQVGGSNPIQVTTDTDISELPTRFHVHQNYPNPFNPTTNIRFELPAESVVNMRLFDVLGREVVTLISAESMSAGVHNVQFDASSLASGMYIYRVELNNEQSITRKMTLIK